MNIYEFVFIIYMTMIHFLAAVGSQDISRYDTQPNTAAVIIGAIGILIFIVGLITAFGSHNLFLWNISLTMD